MKNKGIKQAVILVGGKGSRLGKITKETPKPLLTVAGRPFLDYLLWNLKRYKFNSVILSSCFCSDEVYKYVKNFHIHGIDIICLDEKEPLGTGGAIRFSAPYLESEFIVINGDSLFDVNYNTLFDLLLKSPRSLAVMALREVSDNGRYGSVVTKGGLVVKFSEKDKKYSGVINGGVYAFKRKVIDFLPDGPSSLEKDLFPLLVQHRLLMSHKWNNFFIDIGIHSDLSKAQIEVPLWFNV
jgi:NDP-sugar pyrophosphorylase family protein